MLKTFKYRLYPTKKQETLLKQQLEELRWLWNTLLAERKVAWEERQEMVEYYDQKAELPVLKAEQRPGLKNIHSQVLQDVTLRMKHAMDAFFRRRKAGETPGYPRFKGKGRYDSLTYPQWENGVRLTNTLKRITFSKVGDVKIMYHRPLEGTPKTACMRRTATGKWFVSIACEWEPTPLPPTGKEVGIDVGLKTFAACSDEQKIDTPHFFRMEEKELAKAQRNHQIALDRHKATRQEVTQRMKRDHPESDEQTLWQLVCRDHQEHITWKKRQQRRKVVSRIHERSTWKRDDFTHQKSRAIVNQFAVIAIEDLNISHMVHNHTLAKSIHDVAWGQFAELLHIKAEWAGRAFIAVNPAYTTQDCSGCGHRKTDLTLADRIYHCLECGLILDRDVNAALNILARGRACLGLAS